MQQVPYRRPTNIGRHHTNLVARAIRPSKVGDTWDSVLMTQEILWRLVENLNLSIGLHISPRRPLPVARQNDLFRLITSNRCLFIASILCSLFSNINVFGIVCV